MIIGIDLGTTNSLCAYYSEEGAKIIPNRLGKALTPSVVAVDKDGVVLVGETAKEYALMHPESSAGAFKRFMGTDKKYMLGGHEYTAEELSAFVLRALKEDAEVYLNEEVTEALISVPAYFDDRRRKAVKRASFLAGLKVERIISEPTAAAAAYGLYEKKNTRFLVFDLGGGTFDVSIIELFESILEVRAVAGDNYLGGEDFTEILAKEFLDKNEISADLLTFKELGRLYQAAEAAKRGFSDKDEADINIAFLREGEDESEEKRLSISLKDYEALCAPLLEKIRKPVQRSLADAHIRLADIDEVVLVGGATRLPIVHNFIVKLFRKFPDTSINPDEAVAMGAAVAAAVKERNEALKEVILTDVCSFTLGTEVSVELADGTYEAGHFMPIIDRNTVIPVSRTERVYTLYDNQESIRINVLQGESRLAKNNLLLGSMSVSVPKAEAGSEMVDITYTYDINSLLEVEAKILSTGEVKKQIIKGNSNDMSEDEMKRRMEEISYLKVHPRDQEENRLLLLRGERLYEESAKDVRARIDKWMRKFEQALSTRDSESIERARGELRERLNAVERG